MSTLRVSNIEAKADPSSPSVNEKVKITNSNGDVMLQLDGATSGITTVGITTTGNTLTVDSYNNVIFSGIVTATSFSGSVSAVMSSTAPSNPSDGNFWWDTNSGELYVYYDDGASAQWIQANGAETIWDRTGTVIEPTNSGDTLRIGAGTSIYSPASNVLALGTSGSEGLRVTSGGDVQIANGNLVFSTSGTGIDFSANSNAAGMTSELLDDYEEGTFTPTFTAGTVSGGYTRQVGEYTKVGRLVTFTLTIDGDGNLQGAAQAIEIGGLPFTSRNVAEIGGAQVTYPGNFDTTNNRRFWLVAQNNTTLSYRDSSANNINGNAVNNVNSQLNLCGYYFTDA